MQHLSVKKTHVKYHACDIYAHHTEVKSNSTKTNYQLIKMDEK
jgi:hypothetical protein